MNIETSSFLFTLLYVYNMRSKDNIAQVYAENVIKPLLSDYYHPAHSIDYTLGYTTLFIDKYIMFCETPNFNSEEFRTINVNVFLEVKLHFIFEVMKNAPEKYSQFLQNSRILSERREVAKYFLFSTTGPAVFEVEWDKKGKTIKDFLDLKWECNTLVIALSSGMKHDGILVTYKYVRDLIERKKDLYKTKQIKKNATVKYV